MARAMWKGAVQFGLVTIPVKLYLATESRSTVSFNMLHETDLSRINMKIWCPADEKIISRTETVKGYEYAPDQYVVITDEDLEAVPLKTVRSIEIEQFTAADGADGTGHTRFVKQAYYLEPDKIGRKAFYLLKQVLERKGLTAICKVVIKDREALAAIEPFGETMLLQTLHWPDEIRPTKELDLPAEEFDFRPAELAMAEQLVEAMTGDFEPGKYRDEYNEALRRIIEQKVEGVEVVAPAPVEEAGSLIDLMAALEASVKAATSARDAEKPVSVSEAKKERAGRPAPKKKAAQAAEAAEAEKAEKAEKAEEARPARRRKSA